jgi:hypothetical protein
MSATELAYTSLAVSLFGHLVQFGLFMIHCRRDKREIRRLEQRPEVAR